MYHENGEYKKVIDNMVQLDNGPPHKYLNTKISQEELNLKNSGKEMMFKRPKLK